MLRIISGERKGRIIKTLAGNNTRPTTDRVKESLFNIILPKLPGSLVLDLFSGSGNLGLEALSRGAERTFFVEKNRAALKILYENCQSLDYLEFSEIFPLDVKKAIAVISKRNLSFDIIFIDPPYAQGLEVSTILALDEFRLLKPESIIIVEHMNNNKLPSSIGSLKRYDLRKYGNTAVSFYRKEACLK